METKKTPKANLENKKVLFREIGLIVALSLAILAFEWKTYDKTITVLDIGGYTEILDEFPIITRPDPPIPPEIPQRPVVSDVIEIVDPSENIPDDWIPFTEDDKGRIPITIYTPPKPSPHEDIDEDIPSPAVEEKPQFMGGDEREFTKWVSKNMTYPEVAIANKIEGRVICSFVVTKEGRVADVKVLRGVDASLDKEALRVISMSPKWTPGKQYGKPVRVKYTFPVIFKLK